MMSLLALLRRTLSIGITVFLATCGAVVGFSLLQPLAEPEAPTADLIVVLGGGMSPDGTLHRSTTVRVDRGVALFLAGAAPRMHFTGGRGHPDGPSAGERMAERALAAGVPSQALSTETTSQSTLQNALFSADVVNEAKHILLVTEGFHLPRSWLSFKAFGAGKITLIHARPFRGNFVSSARMVIRESLAIWFNLARYGLWQASRLTPITPNARNNLLH